MPRTRAVTTALIAATMIGMTPALAAGAAEVIPTGVVSWGGDFSRQLGDGDPNQNQPRAVPVDLSDLTDSPILEVCGGFEHSLARAADGTLYGWGSDFYGQLGQGDDLGVTEYGSPVLIETDDVIVDIDCGNKFSLAVTDAGQALAWGQNGLGQLGDGTAQDRAVPIDIPLPVGSAPVIAVSGGDEFSVALLDDGTVLTWGRNDRGQLGRGTLGGPVEERWLPVALPSTVFGGEPVVAISAGLGHSLAVTETGVLWSWGQNNDGQIGDDSTTDRTVPVRVAAPTLPDGQIFIGVAAGSFHSVALTSAGTLYAWGGNFVGAIGDGTSEQRRTPVAVSTGDGSALRGQTVTAVSAGTDYTLALTAAGRAVTWGGNDRGRLGAPSTNTVDNKSTLPTEVRRSDSAIGTQLVSAIGAGFEHAVAVTAVLVEAPLEVDQPGTAPVSRSFVFSGSGEPTATITLLAADDTVLGSAVVGADGRWSLQPSAPLPYGSATYTLRQSFPGTDDTEVDVTLTVAPAPLEVTAETDADGIVTISGTGEPGGIITVTDASGSRVAIDDGEGGTTESAVVGADGVIRLILALPLDAGPQQLSVSQAVAGVVTASVPLSVVVPAAPPIVTPPGAGTPTVPGASPSAPGVDRDPLRGSADERRGALVRTGTDLSATPFIGGAVALGVGLLFLVTGRLQARRRSAGDSAA